MNMMTRGAKEANEESARMAHARALGEAAGKLLAALNSLPTEADVRRIVREELARTGIPGMALARAELERGAPWPPLECNCHQHRIGESSGGWYCPAHGQQL